MLKDSYYPWKELIGEINDIEELLELYADEDDEDLRQELQGQIDALDGKFKPLRLKTLLVRIMSSSQSIQVQAETKPLIGLRCS